MEIKGEEALQPNKSFKVTMIDLALFAVKQLMYCYWNEKNGTE